MEIRLEDKQAVKSLALIGGVICACFTPLVIYRTFERHRQSIEQQYQLDRENVALQLFESSAFASEKLGPSGDSITELARNIQDQSPKPDPIRETIWTKIPSWAVIGICAGGGLAGWIAGYRIIWLTFYLGSFVLYKFIRCSYDVAKHFAPGFVDDTTGQNCKQEQYSRRKEYRLFPAMLRMALLLIIGLAVLAGIIYYLTG